MQLDFDKLLQWLGNTLGAPAGYALLAAALVIIVWRFAGREALKMLSAERDKASERSLAEQRIHKEIAESMAATSSASKDCMEIAQRMQEQGIAGLKIVDQMMQKMLNRRDREAEREGLRRPK